MAKKKKAAAKKPAKKKTAKKAPAKKKAAKKAAKKTAEKAAKKKPAKKQVKKAAKKATKKAGKKATKKAGKKTKRQPSAAFMKPLAPDDTLAAVVGPRPQPRTEITKKIWAYIRKHDLQDQQNRRMINADDTLRPLFGGKGQVSMFELTKLVNGHLA